MEISLSGRSAIVTGGSKGIGFAIAKRFAESGADVAIVARGRGGLDAAVAAIKTVTNAHVIGVQGDVGKAADVQRAYDEAMAAFGKLDIAVNNAGTSRAGPFEAMSDAVLQEDLELKLFAAVRFALMADPSMMANGRPVCTELRIMTAEARSSPCSRLPGKDAIHLMPLTSKSPPR